ncbi:unnamed protein product [Discosporangium mesarthrocarpum]
MKLTTLTVAPAIVLLCETRYGLSFLTAPLPSTLQTSHYVPSVDLLRVSNDEDASLSKPMYLKAFEFYSAWNRGDIDEAMEKFSTNIVFHDMNNKDPFIGRRQLRRYLEECSDALPGWQFVIDDHAWDEQQRKLGLYWHVSNSDGEPIPFPARGLSFITFDEEGLIKTNIDIPEPAVKAGFLQLPLLKFVSKTFGYK